MIPIHVLGTLITFTVEYVRNVSEMKPEKSFFTEKKEQNCKSLIRRRSTDLTCKTHCALEHKVKTKNSDTIGVSNK